MQHRQYTASVARQRHIVYLLVPGFAQQVECLLLCGLGFWQGGQLDRSVQRLGHRGSMERWRLGMLCRKTCAVLCPCSRLCIQYRLVEVVLQPTRQPRNDRFPFSPSSCTQAPKQSSCCLGVMDIISLQRALTSVLSWKGLKEDVCLRLLFWGLDATCPAP